MPTMRVPLLLSVAIAAAIAGGPVRATGSVDPAALEAKREQSRLEFEQLSRQAALSRERLIELTSEVAAIRKDNATLTAALIQAAKTEKKLADEVAAIESRIDVLNGDASAIRASLAQRRDVLAEVLGALQRMGLNPPPAILVTPDDALASVRSAILLGAVVPDLKHQTDRLLADLEGLTRVTATLADERSRLATTIGAQAAEKERLALLLAEKRKLQDASEATLKGEAERAAALARQADSVQELIASLESEIAGVRAAAEEARRAEQQRARLEAERLSRPVPEGNRLVEAPPFDAMKGQVSLPAAGRVTRRFGQADGIGGAYQGDTVTTQSGAIVTAPAEASVLYAGPFRSYGQLLILNAGSGYHIVLAGMGRINVGLGQTVLAGEPVGAMGEARLASAAAPPAGSTEPELYVEFRKEGKPVDPSPWWSDRASGRTGNGT